MWININKVNCYSGLHIYVNNKFLQTTGGMEFMASDSGCQPSVATRGHLQPPSGNYPGATEATKAYIDFVAG